MLNLAIIGAGQLGSRHLQAISNLDCETLVYVVDPNNKSLKIAQERFKEVYNSKCIKKIIYLNKITDINKKLDLAIVATNSDVRKSIIEELLSYNQVNFLILEKVLFQRLEDYDYIELLLNNKNTKAWVNCPRRMWPFYKTLKKRFLKTNLFEINFIGSNWGLASNSIHFIDLLSYLTDSNEYTITDENLDNELIESKRKGFYEFSGTIKGIFNNNFKFNLISYKDGTLPFIIEIYSDNSFFYIREWEGKVIKSSKSNDWKYEYESFDTPYQSNLTHLAVQKIMNTGISDLTPFSESSKLHKPILRCFLNYLSKKLEKKIEICPIT